MHCLHMFPFFFTKNNEQNKKHAKQKITNEMHCLHMFCFLTKSYEQNKSHTQQKNYKSKFIEILSKLLGISAYRVGL